MLARLSRFAFLAAGIGLLFWLLRSVDLEQTWSQLLVFGLPGMAAVLALSVIEFGFDARAWQLCLPAARLNRRWLARLFAVRMAGEALNIATPFGGMGGEPFKAYLLNRRYGIPYPDAAASLVLAKTLTVFALLAFLLVGFFWMTGDARIEPVYKTSAWVGLGLLTLGISGFFVVQRYRLFSRSTAALGGFKPLRLLNRLVHHLEAFDHQLVDFYTRQRARSVSAVTFAFANWVVGAAMTYVTLDFLGYPVTFWEAWMIEAVAQAVRAATFYIPGSVGAQEGAFIILLQGLAGDGALGLAAALVRRARELAWFTAGLGVAYLLLRSDNVVEDASEPD